jgi:uncharacterized ParB-like nuclease family protein
MTTLPLNQINTTPAELARVRPCQDTLTRYIKLMEAGEQLPPVTVFHDGKTYWLVDGRHRLEARKRVGYSDIPVEVKSGSERDAQLYAFSANLSHGLASNSSDRKKVARLLLEDKVWKDFPNRKISEICGLSHTTIGAIRNRSVNLSKNSNPCKVVSPKRLRPREDSKLKKLDSQCDSYDPAEDEHKEALQVINDLAAENEKLRESIALGNLDLPEEKKLDLAAQLQELRKNLEVSEATNKTISISRDTLMNRCSELINKVKKLQYVLNRKDEEIEGLKEDLARATKKVEITEGGSRL